MLILKTLELINFRSYKHLLLDNIDTLGLTLISGGNGSGKSTVRNALEYLLIDTTSESIPLDEFSLNQKGDCTLRCVILNGNDIIEIIKYREHKKHGNSTVLSVNGNSEKYTESDRRETQKNIFKLLDITKELLPISSIFSQHSQSFTNSKETDRKKIIYDAKKLHKYTQYSDKAKEKEKELTDEINNIKSKIPFIKEDIDSFELEVEKNTKAIEKYEELREEEIKELEKDKDKRITEYNDKKSNDIKAIEKEIKIIEKDISNITIEITEHNNILKDLLDKAEKLDFLDKMETEKDKLIENKNEFIIEKKDVERQLNRIGTNMCPVLNTECSILSDKKDETILKLTPKLNKINNKISSIEDKINKLSFYIDNNISLTSSITVLQSDIEEKEIYKRDLIEKIAGMNDKIGCILSDNGEGLQDVIELIDKRIKDAKNKDNIYKTILDNTNKLLKDKRQKFKELTNSIKELEEIVKYYNFWKVGYGKAGIPNMKAEGFLHSLEFETNKILSTISDRMFVVLGSQSVLKDKTISEKISYKVYHPNKTITDFNSYSSGEKQRIILSDIFSFNKLLSKFNFIILDEILELSLDDNGKSDVLKLLRSKVNEIGTILVVSHSNQIKDSFDTVIEVKKIDGVSKINIG